MLAVSNNYELFFGDEKVVDLEHRDAEYEVFLYKDLINSIYQVFYVPDAHKETDEDYANFEFLGSILVPADSALELMSKKKQLLLFLYNKVDSLYKLLLENYSILEKESWIQQETEARALLAVKTPLIDALCVVRGCSRDELAQKIVANADAAKIAGTSILSWQQGLEEEIKKMTLVDFSGIWEIINNKQI